MRNISESKPLVSIIITTYKGDWKLCRAIESCLTQTYSNIEVIVVDDNGDVTDGRQRTMALMKKYQFNFKVIYVKHSTNKNGAAARNTGIKYSHGSYLAFLDDDDVYRNDKIAKCVKAIEMNKTNSAGVYVGVVSIVGNKCVARCIPNLEGDIHDALLINQGLLGSGSNIFIPRWVAERVGGFDESFQRFQDVEFMVRAANYLHMIPIDECMIIKDNTNVRFVPNYQGLKDATYSFIKKFKAQINNCSEGEKAIFNKYVFLLFYAYKCNDKVAIRETKKSLFELNIPVRSLYRIVTKGNFLRYSDSKLYKIYKYLSDKRSDKRIRSKLNVEELNFIETVNHKTEENYE